MGRGFVSTLIGLVLIYVSSPAYSLALTRATVENVLLINDDLSRINEIACQLPRWSRDGSKLSFSVRSGNGRFSHHWVWNGRQLQAVDFKTGLGVHHIKRYQDLFSGVEQWPRVVRTEFFRWAGALGNRGTFIIEAWEEEDEDTGKLKFRLHYGRVLETNPYVDFPIFDSQTPIRDPAVNQRTGDILLKMEKGIMWMDAKGNHRRLIVPDTVSEGLSLFPVWISKDSFVFSRSKDSSGIHSGGLWLQQQTATPLIDWPESTEICPTPSPSVSKLAFVSNADRLDNGRAIVEETLQWHIYVADLSQGVPANIVRITPDEGFGFPNNIENLSIAWLDDSSIAYVSRTGELFMARDKGGVWCSDSVTIRPVEILVGKFNFQQKESNKIGLLDWTARISRVNEIAARGSSLAVAAQVSLTGYTEIESSRWVSARKITEAIIILKME